MNEPLLFTAATVSKPETVERRNVTAPYQRNSDTSRAGARAAQPNVRTQCAAYMELLRSRGAQGMTDHYAAERLGLPDGRISARRRALVLRGEVFDSGRRVDGGYGSPVTVWVAREFYREPDRR